MKLDIEESNGNRIRHLLHNCNKFLFYHVGKGAQQNKAISFLLDGPMSQKDLQDHLDIKPASVSELISKLESKGLVERSRNESDRRVVMLSLTEDGKKQEKTREKIVSSDELFSCLNEEEQEQLIFLLDKLFKGFEDFDNSKAE